MRGRDNANCKAKGGLYEPRTKDDKKSQAGLGANLVIVSQRVRNGSRQLIHLMKVSVTKPYATVSSVGIDPEAANLGQGISTMPLSRIS